MTVVATFSRFARGDKIAGANSEPLPVEPGWTTTRGFEMHSDALRCLAAFQSANFEVAALATTVIDAMNDAWAFDTGVKPFGFSSPWHSSCFWAAAGL